MKRLAVVAALLLIASPAFSDGYLSGIGGGSSIKPRMALPDSIFVAEGRELNIYDTQLPVSPFGGYPFSFLFGADFGAQAERSFQWTPTTEVNKTISINAVSPGGASVESKTIAVSSVLKSSGEGDRNIIFIGSSTFGQDLGVAAIIGETDSLFSADGGSSITPYGVETYGGYYHESFSGRTWERYVTDYAASGDTNRFWDSGKTDSRLDFQGYSEGYLGGIDIDGVVAYLGTNDIFIKTSEFGKMSSSEVGEIVAFATSFIDTLTSATYGYPDCKVWIVLPYAGSAWKSSWGTSYPNNETLEDYLFNMRQFQNACIAAFDGGSYSGNVDVIAGNLWVDNLEGFPYSASAYSDRVTTSLNAGTDFLHATEVGRNQLADAIYSHMKHTFDVPIGCQNELTDSWQFADTGIWYNNTATFTPTTGQADPWGGTHATLFTAVATTSFTGSRLLTPWDITADDVVFSVFLKNVDLNTAEHTSLRLYNSTFGTTGQVDINWTSTPSYNGGAGVSDGGIIDRSDLGVGWWQLWGLLDLSGDAGEDFNIRVYPCDVSPVIGEEILIGGMQLEYDVLEPCGTYVEKP